MSNFKLVSTLYGVNIYRRGRKIEGPYDSEYTAKRRVEELEAREPKLKTYGFMPATLLKACERLADRVDEVGNEGEDGYWIYLRAGWFNPVDGIHAIHEDTIKKCLDKLAGVRQKREGDPS